MGFQNREKELKLLVYDYASMAAVDKQVKAFVEEVDPDHESITGDASDIYWHAPEQSVGDFVRLRKQGDGSAQITMKATDRGDNYNRVEIDLDVEDWRQAKVLLEGIFGDEAAKVRKRYQVYLLDDDHTTLSVYQITGDSKVFVEIEGRRKDRIRSLTKQFADFSQFKMTVVKDSIYDMYVEGQGNDAVNEVGLEEFMEEF